MAITFEEVIPSPIQNATVVKGLVDGVHRNYRISPVSGYVLHDNFSDWTDIDPVTGEEVLYRGYLRGTMSVAANYDFAVNPRELYTVPENEVPADQIFGGGDSEPEVM